MELKAGYKQTEAGMIPFEWDAKKIADVAPLQRGFDLPASQLEKGPYPVVYSNGVLNYHSKAMTNSPGVITGRSGTIGRVHYIETDYWPHNTTLWVTDFKGNFPRFIYYLYTAIGFDRFGTGSGVPTLNRNDVHAFRVAVPPLPEQRAIAAALSDVDALISGLDKLIAKKCDIKQAAMQQLLTGKKRLPGFTGEWAVKKLGEISEVLKGNGLSKSKLTASGSRKCILYGELFTTYQRTITDVVSRTDSLEGRLSKHGDVLMPGSTTTVGIDLATASALLEEGVALGGDINIIRQRDTSYVPVFLANHLTHVKKFAIAGLAQGITIIHLYGRNLVDLSIELPILAEQQAIAEVLSDMDAEIAALEQKRDKTRALKQGMMQELLTGRIRLV